MFIGPNGQPLTAAFHHHAGQAEWHTINCLVRLSGNPVDGVANKRIAVVEWWRTVESLVALLHLVALFESSLGLRPDQPRLTTSKRAGFHDRWSAVGRWFSASSDSPPKQLTQRVLELRDYRNSFEHTSRLAVIEVRHSRLGTVPAYANLSDAMEAMAICIEASSVFRYVLNGMDLMPQCVVPSNEHVFYVSLDRLAGDLLFPQYRRVVDALDLETDVALYPAPRPLHGTSVIAPAMGIKATPGREDVGPAKPLDVWSGFEEFVAAQPNLPSPEEFGLPNYMRQADLPGPSK